MDYVNSFVVLHNSISRDRTFSFYSKYNVFVLASNYFVEVNEENAFFLWTLG